MCCWTFDSFVHWIYLKSQLSQTQPLAWSTEVITKQNSVIAKFATDSVGPTRSIHIVSKGVIDIFCVVIYHTSSFFLTLLVYWTSCSEGCYIFFHIVPVHSGSTWLVHPDLTWRAQVVANTILVSYYVIHKKCMYNLYMKLLVTHVYLGHYSP